MGKIEDNKQQKKERLLETAFSLFTSKGMAKTSVSDITASAGIAKGTFYLYFRDKYDLGDKLIAHKSANLFRHAIEQVKRSDAATAEDKIIVLVDDVLNQLQKDPLALRFINKNLSWSTLKKALSRPDAVEEMDYLGYIQSILYESDTEWIEPDIMMYTVIALIGSTCHNVILEHDPVDLDHYKPFLFQTVRSILRIHQKPKA